jgi:hypothetical protein
MLFKFLIYIFISLYLKMEQYKRIEQLFESLT